MEPAYRKAAVFRPEFDAVVRHQLDMLRQLETEKCDSIDRAADAFAQLISSAAKELADSNRRRVLEQIL